MIALIVEILLERFSSCKDWPTSLHGEPSSCYQEGARIRRSLSLFVEQNKLRCWPWELCTIKITLLSRLSTDWGDYVPGVMNYYSLMSDRCKVKPRRLSSLCFIAVMQSRGLQSCKLQRTLSPFAVAPFGTSCPCLRVYLVQSLGKEWKNCVSWLCGFLQLEIILEAWHLRRATPVFITQWHDIWVQAGMPHIANPYPYGQLKVCQDARQKWLCFGVKSSDELRLRVSADRGIGFALARHGLHGLALLGWIHQKSALCKDVLSELATERIGCGYGEMGRQVAKISGASVRALKLIDIGSTTGLSAI